MGIPRTVHYSTVHVGSAPFDEINIHTSIIGAGGGGGGGRGEKEALYVIIYNSSALDNSI